MDYKSLEMWLKLGHVAASVMPSNYACRIPHIMIAYHGALFMILDQAPLCICFIQGQVIKCHVRVSHKAFAMQVLQYVSSRAGLDASSASADGAAELSAALHSTFSMAALPAFERLAAPARAEQLDHIAQVVLGQWFWLCKDIVSWCEMLAWMVSRAVLP